MWFHDYKETCFSAGYSKWAYVYFKFAFLKYHSLIQIGSNSDSFTHDSVLRAISSDTADNKVSSYDVQGWSVYLYLLPLVTHSQIYIG